MTYTLITANRNYSSWSLRPWILMKALEIPFIDDIIYFEEENYERFREFAPNGQVPCLKDDRGDGRTDTIWDSLAIVEYLAERHGGCWPDDGNARTWARCAAAEMHGGFAPLRNICTMNVGVRATLHNIETPLQRNINRIGELFAQGQDNFGGPWLTGQSFSAVDAFFAPVAYRVRSYDLDIGAKGRGWVDRMIAHPAMQDWERQALAETQREIGHEDEIAAAATVTADYRAG
ncbi:MAG: glutathione S-transferase family protein [Sphingomonadales bacterium]|nr:glutathione S-transferase family protein [Sphingomonadales bacterium]PIX65707.1 MAG: glutathione S-transferase [Sphingomonadales bacterium CG_4_10_14_3_um_filter_58_15]NCO49615.1 glutathione S-transferase family protein [Sphingomonadales bacterium]NCP00269.1 glutathione S-transferase family protein [Sphingomonadales bacterium]NCP26237.1 glutathione S-transferase family protein [Sphingomonadales bacterium]